jgi:hypothetical protein
MVIVVLICRGLALRMVIKMFMLGADDAAANVGVVWDFILVVE